MRPLDEPNSVSPILDLSLFHDSATRLQFSHELIAALQCHGYACVVNHSISPGMLTQAFSMTHDLFALPLHIKNLAPHPQSPLHHRGYSQPGQEKISSYALDSPDSPAATATSTAPIDLRESYEIGSERNTHEPNIWLPEAAFPGFRTWGVEFYAECHKLATQLLRAVALGLGAADGAGDEGAEALDRLHDGYGCQLRLLHYPAVARRDLEEGRVARMPAHCDWSTMTMLFQDDCGGLEVADPQTPSIFVPVTPVPGACVLTVGDLLMRWSNDKLKSSLHRVALPPVAEAPIKEKQTTKARYSIPFFISPHPDTLVRCLSSCTDAQQPARYEPVTQGAYNRQKMNLQYSTDEAQSIAVEA